MKRILAPIVHRDSYTREVARHVVGYFTDVLFAPLLDILEDAGAPKIKENAAGPEPSAVKAALDVGSVWYADGVFSGSFTVPVAREIRALGATFDPIDRVFRIPVERLTPDLKVAAVSSIDRSRELHGKLGRFLDEAQKNFAGAATGIDVDLAVKRITDDLQAQFARSVTGIEFVTVEAQVSPGMRAAITRELTENLDLYAKNFLSTEIPELRRMVEANAFAGARPDAIAREIQARYGVTRRKAEFLADQESSLIVSNYRKQQALSIGAVSYKWSTSHDERVRPDHKLLNGLVFAFDSPPVTNRKTGARNNPGEDFRCRCVAMPILEFPK